MRDENRQLTVEELVRAHFEYSASNPGKWAELLADNASWEFPYGDAVGLKTLEGKPAMVNLVSTFMEPLRDYAYGKPSIHLLPDGSSAVAEFSGQGIVTANGRTYANKYVLFVETAGGKITKLREYFNPAAIKAAFGEGA
jgi:ketosteroid isomerase-like protein